MPRYVGMVVSIVGGLVLGETAVTAGIISAPTLMIVALSGICLYTVPELEQTFSILRIAFLIIAGSLGGYGLIVAIATLIIYLVAFENYSTPVLAPFAPLIKKDLKDGIYKGFIQEHEFRPQSIKNVNKRRIKLK
jgi:spore germination protein KA